MAMRMGWILAVSVMGVAAVSASGAVTTSLGAGSAVTSADRSSTFDALNYAGRGTPLSDYVTVTLSVQTNGNSYYGDDARGKISTNGVCFNPFHITTAMDHSYADVGGGFYFPYDGDFGNSDWVTIGTTDNQKIYALEFLYGNGWTTGDIYGTQTGYPWGNSTATLEWKALLGNTVVDSGDFGSFLQVGTTVGFVDPVGFDRLMVRATTVGNGNLNELAMDNLVVQVTAVPEAGTLGVLIAGLGVLGRRRKRAFS